jgi:hypothetical protein
MADRQDDPSIQSPQEEITQDERISRHYHKYECNKMYQM